MATIAALSTLMLPPSLVSSSSTPCQARNPDRVTMKAGIPTLATSQPLTTPITAAAANAASSATTRGDPPFSSDAITAAPTPAV